MTGHKIFGRVVDYETLEQQCCMEVVPDSRSCACRELTGRVIVVIVARHHWWYKAGVLTVTCDTELQIGGSISSPTARSRG